MGNSLSEEEQIERWSTAMPLLFFFFLFFFCFSSKKCTKRRFWNIKLKLEWSVFYISKKRNEYYDFWCCSNSAIRPPCASLFSTRIPPPIPATGLPATHSGIIESEPWSCICIEMEWHAGGCSAGHPYHLFLIKMKSFAEADCFLLSVDLCVGVCVWYRECPYASLPPLVLLSIVCPCQCIKMTPFQIRWQIATWQIMQMAQWWHTYLLVAQLF